jgi:hypothetical protein
MGGRTPDDPRRRAREVRRLSTINDDGREPTKSRVEFPLRGRHTRPLFRGDSVTEAPERILGRRILEDRLSAAMNAALERNWRKSSASSQISSSASVDRVDWFDSAREMDDDLLCVDRGGCGAGRGLSKTGRGPNSGIGFFPT